MINPDMSQLTARILRFCKQSVIKVDMNHNWIIWNFTVALFNLSSDLILYPLLKIYSYKLRLKLLFKPCSTYWNTNRVLLEILLSYGEYIGL